MGKCNDPCNIDDFINRTESLNRAFQFAEEIAQRTETNDTFIVIRVTKLDDNTGRLEAAVHGCNCGIEHAIIHLARESGIPLAKLALDELLEKFKKIE